MAWENRGVGVFKCQLRVSEHSVCSSEVQGCAARSPGQLCGCSKTVYHEVEWN